jgi:hypothetical protein
VDQRQQPRLEKSRLADDGYWGPRCREIAEDYAEYRGGLSVADWLRCRAADMIREAEALEAQGSLLATAGDEVDVIASIIAATDGRHARKRLLALRQGYTHRWTAEHDQMARDRLAEIDRERSG